MHLVIDAHNLRSGGGRTYIRYLLHHVSSPHPFRRVTVVCFPDLVRDIGYLREERAWLTIMAIEHLARHLVARRLWHDTLFPQLLARLGADVVFAPGGILPRRRPPGSSAVVLIQNMLLFQPREAARYGTGPARLRLARLRGRVVASLAQADGAIFPSEFGRYMATVAVPQSRAHTTVIPNGVDPRFRDPNPGARARRVPKRLLYVSTLDVYKHQDTVVGALGLLRKQGHHDLHLHLVGPWQEPMLGRVRRAIAETGLHEQVALTPGVSHDALPGVYHAADIGLFASSCETFPNILLEMMAAGLPMVCSVRLPMPDVCLDDAVYADPEDPEALAAAVARLLADDAARRRMGRRLAERASAYDWPTCARHTFAFLGEVALGQR